MDSLLGWNMQRSGLVDTMWDLIVDSLGALLAAGLSYLYIKDANNNDRQSMIVKVAEKWIRKNMEARKSA